MSKYLFIGAHLDDVELSCGGLIAKMVQENHFVHVASMTEEYGGINLYEEFHASMGVLGVEYFQTYNYEVRTLSRKRNELCELITYWADEMDYVVTHSSLCKHPDHRAVGEESKRVIKGSFITYLQPWNGNENPNYFIELSEEQLEKKIAALACYKSQAHRSYMDPDFIRSWARYTGIKCGKKYAEGFKIERYIT